MRGVMSAHEALTVAQVRQGRRFSWDGFPDPKAVAKEVCGLGEPVDSVWVAEGGH